MLSEPYNFSKEHYEKYSNIKDDKEELEYDNIKQYKCTKLLGEGSYSSVYEVKNEENNKYFALKVCKEDDDVSKNEITVLRKLGKHKNIIELHDSFHYKNKKNKTKHLCMVLDNLGCDLNVVKRLFKYKGDLEDSDLGLCSSNSNNSNSSNYEIRRGMPLNLSKKIGYQILDALSHMHDKNIIHTDLKLENILVVNNLLDIKYNKDINIKICDFGTSHQTNQKCNFNIGTVDYSPPECIIGLPYGKSIDIWSFGCILYELITGQCLFDYTRYYYDADECSSGYTSSSGEDENDKTQIEFLLLCMMKIILGSFPSKLFKRGKYYENYFDYKGRLRFTPKFIEEEEIINLLINDFGFDDNTASEINEFLLKCLCINPSERHNVHQLLTDKWLSDKCE